MKTVYFIRHGESSQNAGNVYQGDIDALTEKGEKQAEFIAKRCARLPLEALVASTMVRAQDTAKKIAQATGLPIESSGLFVERRDPSELIGVPRDAHYMEKFKAWTDTFFVSGTRVSDGENYQDIHVRGTKALTFLKDRPEAAIAVVTHGFFLRMLLAQIIFGSDLTPARFQDVFVSFRSTNTGLTVIQSPPKKDIWSPWMEKREWVIQVWNDRAHLG